MNSCKTIITVTAIICVILKIKFLLLLSTIVTTARPGVIRFTRLGNERCVMVRRNSSSSSNILSSLNGTSNETLVSPAVNVTVYGPES